LFGERFEEKSFTGLGKPFTAPLGIKLASIRFRSFSISFRIVFLAIALFLGDRNCSDRFFTNLFGQPATVHWYVNCREQRSERPFGHSEMEEMQRFFKANFGGLSGLLRSLLRFSEHFSIELEPPEADPEV
jgi:hypothetical protein